MSIKTLKTIACMLLAGCMSSSLWADEGKHWQQNFDDQTAGARPKHSGMSWGKMDDSLIYITNSKSVSAPNSFMVDRTGGEKYNMWGYELRVPHISAPWLTFSTCFQVVGPSYDTRTGLEFFGRNDKGGIARTLILELGYQRNQAPRIVGLKNGARNSSATLGHYKDAQWYRVTVWLPGEKKTGGVAYGRLEEYEPKTATWQALGPWLQIKTNGITNIREVKLICHRNKFKVFYDNMSIEGKTQLPETIRKD